MNEFHMPLGVTWLSSGDFNRFSKSNGGQGMSPANTPNSNLGSPLHSDHSWYKKVACCHLKSTSRGGGTGQGIIVCLGLDAHQKFAEVLGISTYPPLALLTNHHIIPSINRVQNWKMLISCSEQSILKIKLDRNRFITCVSCCGPDGVWKKEEHPKKSCPLEADFTILPLSKEFAEEIMSKKELLIPVVMPVDMKSLETALQSQRFYIYQRDEDTGHIIPSDIEIQKRGTPTASTIKSKIENYRLKCTLEYAPCLEIRRGSSGAGIFFKQGAELFLLGLHVSTEEGGENCRFGTSIHRIFHAIAGGEVCGLVPSLSLFKEASVHNCLVKQSYQKLQNCLETGKLRGATVHVVPVQAVGDETDSDFSLVHLLEILHFLLADKMVVVNQDSVLSHPTIDLLACLFNQFKQYGGHDLIAAEIKKVFPEEQTRKEFYQKIRQVIKQVYTILKDFTTVVDVYASHTKMSLLESCFNFWHKTSYFPLPGPALFTDSVKFTVLDQIRSSDEHVENATIQRIFADILLAYQSQLKSEREKEFQMQIEEMEKEYHEELKKQMDSSEREKEAIEKRMKDQIKEFEEQIRNTEAENEELKHKVAELEGVLAQRDEARTLCAEKQIIIEELHQQNNKRNSECEQQAEKITSLEQQLAEFKHQCEQQAEEITRLEQQQRHTPYRQRFNSEPAQSLRNLPERLRANYPARSNSSLLEGEELPEDFWKRDMLDLLKDDVQLRTKIAEYFTKTHGSRGTDNWEHFLLLLEEEVHVDMSAKDLEEKPVPEIILILTAAWSKKEKVTIEMFCQASKKLGIHRVEKVMQEVEKNTRNSAAQNV